MEDVLFTISELKLFFISKNYPAFSICDIT